MVHLGIWLATLQLAPKITSDYFWTTRENAVSMKIYFWAIILIMRTVEVQIGRLDTG